MAGTPVLSGKIGDSTEWEHPPRPLFSVIEKEIADEKKEGLAGVKVHVYH